MQKAAGKPHDHNRQRPGTTPVPGQAAVSANFKPRRVSFR
ncbi:hypothetical protein AGRO_3446 [Agrobacterium sp. ATCC 31749]|nr:hypothetical protein AGRO_3446 [Agrobacterium sp. ATCC 31749]